MLIFTELRMNIKSRFLLPKKIDDGRLDLLLEIIASIKISKQLSISFEKTTSISPAGYAILFAIFDAACEQKISIDIQNLTKNQLPPILQEHSKKKINGFIPIENASYENSQMIIYGKSASIAPEFIQKIENKFQNVLNEDRLWDVTLIFNELMQNTVDHSTAERYFLYAGINNKNFEFGLLDLGVSIPAKLETKYICQNDEEYLEHALLQGVGTRRNRTGGLGLYYLFENIKQAHGRLKIISRDAQIIKNFSTRNYLSSKLKHKLSGTWCMASIPVRKI
jgi:hypothetical protein